MYIVEYEGLNLAKIGFTASSLQTRLSQLRGWAGRPDGSLPPLKLLATYEGDRELERALHRHFRHRVVFGAEGFNAAWVKASLPLDLAAICANDATPLPIEDEVTEVLPKGYRAIHPTASELDALLESDAQWSAEVQRLRFPAGLTRTKRMLKRPLTDSEVERLVNGLSPGDLALVWCFLGAGLRYSEVCGCRVGDVQDTYMTPLNRKVYVSKQGQAVLGQWVRTLEDKSPNAPLLPSRKWGGRLRLNSVLDRVARLLTRGKIIADPGSLRTTHMVGLWNQRTNLKVIARQLGYDSERQLYDLLAEAVL